MKIVRLCWVCRRKEVTGCSFRSAAPALQAACSRAVSVAFTILYLFNSTLDHTARVINLTSFSNNMDKQQRNLDTVGKVEVNFLKMFNKSCWWCPRLWWGSGKDTSALWEGQISSSFLCGCSEVQTVTCPASWYYPEAWTGELYFYDGNW